MEKAIEFDIGKEELKKYLEKCLTEENIDYEIKIEDRWIQKYLDTKRGKSNNGKHYRKKYKN